MNKLEAKQVGEIIDILFPLWSHFGNKESLIVHHGEYDKLGERHAGSAYTIQFKKCTDPDTLITIRFWKSGIQIWETKGELSKVVGNTYQFELYRYLLKNNLLGFSEKELLLAFAKFAMPDKYTTIALNNIVNTFIEERK